MKRGAEALRVAVAFGLACSLVGCRSLFKKDAPPAEEVDAGAPQATQADESAIPTLQDFEEEAQEKVTATNFKSELSRLKKEVAGK
jgi:hypothetical protein